MGELSEISRNVGINLLIWVQNMYNALFRASSDVVTCWIGFRAGPIRISKILTDNGKEFIDRLFAARARAPCGTHEFDQLCAEQGIEQRLTPPNSPQTNEMGERFNGSISDVLKTNLFDSALSWSRP